MSWHLVSASGYNNEAATAAASRYLRSSAAAAGERRRRRAAAAAAAEGGGDVTSQTDILRQVKFCARHQTGASVPFRYGALAAAVLKHILQKLKALELLS